jgi:hypothetical protein
MNNDAIRDRIDRGYWLLVISHWSLVIGHLSLNIGAIEYG